MWHSIQQTLRNINSRISLFDLLSLLVLVLVLLGLAIYVDGEERARKLPVVYIPASVAKTPFQNDSRPFGSVSGATYTFSWCQGASQIKYRIYFESEEEAISSGRRLSKLCEN